MKKKLNLKGILLAAVIAVAGAFTVGSTLINKEAQETPTAEKADAAINDNYNHIVGLDGIWNPGGGIVMEKTGGEQKFYYASNVEMAQNAEFKITNGTWDDAKGSYYLQNDTGHNDWFGGDDNIKCIQQGSYDVYWDGSKVHILIGGTLDPFNGWVLAGEGPSFTGGDGWSYKSAIHMEYLGDGSSGDRAKLLGLTLQSGDSFRIAYSDGYQLRDWKNWNGSISKTHLTQVGYNLSVNTGKVGTVNIYLDSEGVGWVDFTLTGYVVTYNRNNAGASSATETRVKSTSSAHTVLNPTTFGWTPSTFKRFVKWNTASDGSGTNYSTGASYSTNAATTLFYVEDWYMYRYKVNSGSWVNLVHNDDGKGADVMVQFAPSSPHELPVGGILSFEYSDDGGSNWKSLTVSTYSGEKNNYSPSTGIKLETNDTIFLKITNGGVYDCWVPGISDRTINIVTDSSATSGGEPYTLKGAGTDIGGHAQCVTTASVYVKRGQFLKAGDFGTLYDVSLDASSSDSFAVVSGTVKCNVTGVFTVYLKEMTKDNWNEVYIERDDSASGTYLAQLFNSAISEACETVVGGGSFSTLSSAWGTNSSSGMYYHFYGQPSGTLNLFKADPASISDGDIKTAVIKYNYIENKYGTSALPNFMGRSDPYKAAVHNFSTLSLFGDNEDGLTTIIIIVSSSIALLSVTALSILVIKKRKNKEE